MNQKLQQRLQQKLIQREGLSLLRTLSRNELNRIDFCSNDYLGLAKENRIEPLIRLNNNIQFLQGSGASRLLSGNFEEAEHAEQIAADFHYADAALIFNSGFAANLALLSAIPYKNDVIIYDALCHASILDGIKLSKAENKAFEHNDCNNLEQLLQVESKGQKFIVIESLYSMDGDFAPLKEMALLAEKYDAALIVDEAHAAGVFGENGKGLCAQNEMSDKVFARVVTYGKAFGLHGAAVLGSHTLRNYLINFGRSFIYSTALPRMSYFLIQQAYSLMPQLNEEREKLLGLIAYFDEVFSDTQSKGSQIKSISAPGNERVRKIALQLQKAGMDARPIVFPTVPKGKERIRICLHAFNTKEEIDLLLHELKKAF